MSDAFAFLVLAEHPYGRQMLAELLAAGLEPALVIEEHSEVARVERRKFEERLAGHPLAPPFEDLLDGRALRRERVGSHNGPACRALLAEARPALMVLGGTGILRERIFRQAGLTLNAHPGLLPEVRGSASVAWAIERDLPIGCTCHAIDAGIDTGPIASRRRIAVLRSDTYESLCWKTTRLSAELMTEAVAAWRAGELVLRPQIGAGTTHRNMPEEGVTRVRAKLASGAYAHFADRGPGP